MTPDEEVAYLRQTLRSLTSAPEAVDVTLSRQHTAILGALLHNRSKVVTREQLMTALYWNRRDDWPEDRIIDVYLSHMRKRLKNSSIVIRTVWGRGWIIDKEPAHA